MKLTVEIADAVKDDLNAGSFSLPFAAERLYLPLFELPEMQVLHVSIVPKGITQTAANRTQIQHDCQVDVAVQQKVAGEAPAEVDPLTDLVEELIEHFRFHRLPAFPTAAWLRTENAPIYDPEHMHRLRQFTSVITLTYRVRR